ncbi:MAG: FtsX-like permease family protein [Clostridiales bacterium]|nr:FtsX-like permease family protein [Clostridiales bacterium]
MKSTQRKDAIRNVRKQIVSYLSIVIIAMLAVLAFLGINYAAKAIGTNGNDFYDETNFRDVQIISTQLITPEDMEAIRNVPGVADVEGVYRTSGMVQSQGNTTDVMVVSLTDRINTVMLLEGRLPSSINECVLEKTVDEDTGLTVGDTIIVSNPAGSSTDYLTEHEFVIAGIVYHPDHSCWQLQTPGVRYVLVLPEAFDTDVLENCYMTAEVSIEGTAGIDRFSDRYFEQIEDTVARLDVLAQERALLRYNDILGRYQSGIDEGQTELDDAFTRLSDARAELDANWQDYYEGVASLEEAQQQLANSEQQLEEAQIQLAEGRAELDEANSELSTGRTELDAAWTLLEQTRVQLEDAEVQLAAGRAQLDENELQLTAARDQLTAAEAQISGGAVSIANGENRLAEGRAELETSYQQIEDAKTSVRDALHDAVLSVLGQDIADEIDWSSGSSGIDIDDSNATATLFPITSSITINLNLSLSDNIYSVISSLGVPEEELREAFEQTTQTVLDISDGRPVLQAVVDYVTEAYNDIDSRYEELASAARTWDAGHSDYISGITELNNARYAYNTGLEQYNSGRASYESGLARYNAGLEQYNEALAQYEDGLAQYQAGLNEYQAGRYLYETNLAEYQRGEAAYQRSLREYNEGLAAYEEGLQQIEDGQDELADALIQLEEGEAEYNEGLAEYNSGADELQAARADMESVDECRWVVLDVEGNAGYLFVKNGILNVSGLGSTFALIFVLVGALVIYATVGRIVEEQRRLVGASKALGLYNREILTKYMIFGVTGTFLGMILGFFAGYFIIQRIVLSMYGRYYVFGAGNLDIDYRLTVFVLVGGLLLSSFTVWFACSSLVKLPATRLMQEDVPSVGKKSKGSKNKAPKGSLYGNLIVLNMLSDKKRVAVTIASIAGCCALLVAGMTMNYAINKSIDAQFSNVELFDLQITFDPALSSEAENEIESILEDEGARYILLCDHTLSYEAGGKLRATEFMVTDVNSLNEFFVRTDPATGSLIEDAGDGIWLQLKVAELNGLKEGDSMTLYDSAMNPHSVNVSGVFLGYAGHFSIMDASNYEQVFGMEPEYNSFFVILDGADDETIRSRVIKVEGVKNFTDKQSNYNDIKKLAAVLDYLSIMFIGIAGMMAYFILLNLVNMYITQKKRELVIMRINGFTVKETIRYVSYELIVSTVLGIIIGLLFGSALGYRIIVLLEGSTLHIIKAIQFKAWIVSAVITVLFSVLISAWALRKVKHLKLIDAAG